MLTIRGIRKTFNPGTVNEVRALQGVDLTIEPGSFVIVLGMNGSGKSTLLNAVAGSFYVDEGTIQIANHDVTKWPEHKRAKLIGRVFQNPFSGTAPTMSIAENFALASKRGHARGLGWALSPHLMKPLRERIATLKMGLEGRLDNAIGSLSGGQRQALTLLMATWLKPELLLLDEPFTGLDKPAQDNLSRLFKELTAEGRLLIASHHDLQTVSGFYDDVLLIKKTQVTFGDVATHFTKENIAAAYGQ